MTCHISCYNNKTRELEHFKVPKPISVYIRQLECEIKYGRGGVQKLYPFRFDGKFDVEDWKKKPLYNEDFDALVERLELPSEETMESVRRLMNRKTPFDND